MSSSSPVAERLQSLIESFYAIDTGICVTHYLVDDATRRRIPGAREGIPEQLFVSEDSEAIDLALYVDPTLLAHIEEDPPGERLHSGNLEPFCVVLEGVSHFVMLAWRAQQDRPVSGLELEIQAEVDKFVLAWLLLAEQGTSMRSSAALLQQRLFRHVSIRAGVPSRERERYSQASRVAESFCSGLARNPSAQRVRQRARRYYRTGLAEKIREHAILVA